MIPAVTQHRVSGPASVSLLHFDGANNGTVFTDVYGTNTWSIGAGSPVTETAQFKFGTAGFAAGGGFIHTTGAPFVLGSSDFTIEVQVFLTSVSTFYGIYAKRAQSTIAVSASLNVDTGSSGRIHAGVSNTTVGSAWTVDLFSGTISLNTWHHVALTRFGTTFTLWLDGVSQQTGTLAGALSDDGTTPLIGALSNDNVIPFVGNLDEFRYSLVARYTSNFTPPVAAFTF